MVFSISNPYYHYKITHFSWNKICQPLQYLAVPPAWPSPGGWLVHPPFSLRPRAPGNRGGGCGGGGKAFWKGKHGEKHRENMRCLPCGKLT